ncbi:hypothetical protein BV25DRAFT_1513280 [Artomyces pyxidatus]|uniref:Uncharacterized protein n=1 Tax=Artomyces pyxidatus TaxID=48021 RepID=A0ACB8TBA3_9AGAM|nr:hypothetical protein BV25DRAFT_1513280 [Artomyces pyxidatus]
MPRGRAHRAAPTTVLLLSLLVYVAPANGGPSDALRTPAAACDSIDSCRTRANIIWGCLATIFACVWTAVHRNIPESASGQLSRAVELTLLVPEWVLTWAVRQFLNARVFGKELEAARGQAERSWETKRWMLRGIGRVDAGEGRARRKTIANGELDESWVGRSAPSIASSNVVLYEDGEFALYESALALEDRAGRLSGKWTTAHGFFVTMGGFHYYEDGKPAHPLLQKDVVLLVMNGELVPPTEEEIRGLSQGDAVSKGLAVVQTLWFVVQCIGRLAAGLPMAQLEVMTLAYTTIRVAVYAFWWELVGQAGAERELPGARCVWTTRAAAARRCEGGGAQLAMGGV